MKKPTNMKPITETTIEPKPEIVAKFRSGVVTATIFQSTRKINNKDINFYNTHVVKNYVVKEEGKDDEWKQTSNFGKEDLIKLKIVVDKALEFLYLNEE